MVTYLFSHNFSILVLLFCAVKLKKNYVRKNSYREKKHT